MRAVATACLSHLRSGKAKDRYPLGGIGLYREYVEVPRVLQPWDSWLGETTDRIDAGVTVMQALSLSSV